MNEHSTTTDTAALQPSRRELATWPLLDRLIARGRRAVLAFADRIDLTQAATAMTCLIVMLHTTFASEELLVGLSVAGLAHAPMRSRWMFWLAMFSVRAVGQLPGHWWEIDNHQWLINWWLLALALAYAAKGSDAVLRRAASALIGLCFAFATLWKLISRDFVTGRFLEWAIITDQRFGEFGRSVLGLPDDTIAANGTTLSAFQADPTASYELISSGRVTAVAIGLTWWTVLIEAAIAVSFLWPVTGKPARLRSTTLLLFVGTTYLIAPVVGFARILLAMSLLAVPSRVRWWPFVAVALFVGVASFDHFDTVMRTVSQALSS